MKRRVSIAVLIFALICFWLAGWVNARWSQAVVRRASPSLAGVGGVSPLVLFTTVALGGFRGLIADMLWLRAGDLQDEGRYFEVVQLADWITKLEPTSTEVWSFHAWNMVYNISIMFPEGADRWRWVQNGIRLLRNEGLLYNPGDPRLYWELGWIYEDKIGGSLQEYSGYFMCRLAAEMEPFFPRGRWDPRAVARDPDRARALREEYRLDPAFLSAVDREFGPVDWRLPESHSLYWAWRGAQVAGANPSSFCDRMMYLSVFDLFTEGRVVFFPAQDHPLRLPQLALSASVVKVFDQVVAREEPQGFREVYAAFLREVVLYLHAFERSGEAERYWRLYAEKFPTNAPASSLSQFVEGAAKSRMSNVSPAEAQSLLERMAMQQFGCRVVGDAAAARGYERLQELFWRGYGQGENADGTPRGVILPLGDIRAQGFRRAAVLYPVASENREGRSESADP